MKTISKSSPKKKAVTKRKKITKVKPVSSGNKELDQAIKLALKGIVK